MIMLKKYLSIAILCMIPSIVDAKSVQKITKLLTTQNKNEGTKGKCIGNVILGKCMEYQEKNYLTLPKILNINKIQNNNEASRGEIVYTFDCRIRKKNFKPKNGVETSTKDSRHPGSIKAKYIFVFNELSIKDMHREGSTGRCGNTIMERMNDF